MQTKDLRRLAAIALALVGNVALAQSGWVEMTSTGSGGLKNLPVNGAHVGDQVLKVGDLEGPGLTREALLALLERNPEPKFVFAHLAKS